MLTVTNYRLRRHSLLILAGCLPPGTHPPQHGKQQLDHGNLLRCLSSHGQLPGPDKGDEAAQQQDDGQRHPLRSRLGGFFELFFGAESAFRGMSSDASLPSPQSAWVRACVRSGSPKTRMNPSDALWSNASPFPYVASEVE